MTIQSQNKRIAYAGNNSTTSFVYDFKILDESDLKVVIQNVAGVDTVQAITTNYTVTGVGNTAGGTVEMIIAPGFGSTISIILDPNLTQLTDYTVGGAFPAESHEDALDKSTNINKRTRDLVERSLNLPDGDVDGSGAYDAKNNRIKNLTTGILGTDLVTKDYVDAQASGLVGAVIATGGVTNRTLQDHTGDMLSVKDFGAIGNGLTDDTVAIQAARAASSVIYFPAGTYRTTATILLEDNAVVVSDDAIILKDFVGVGLHIRGYAAGVQIHGALTVQASPTQTANTAINNTASTSHGIFVENSRLYVTGELQARGHVGHGFHINCTAANMNGSTWTNLVALYNGRNGYLVDGTSDNISVINLRLNAYGNGESGLYIADESQARGWTGLVQAENNGQNGTSDEVYLGRLRSSDLVIYAEQYPGVSSGSELVIGALCTGLQIFDQRDNLTVNNSPQTCQITSGQGTNARGGQAFYGNVYFENMTNSGANTGTLEYAASFGKVAHDRITGAPTREFLSQNPGTGSGLITRMTPSYSGSVLGRVQHISYSMGAALVLGSFNGTVSSPTAKLVTEIAGQIDFDVGTSAVDSYRAVSIGAKVTSVGGGNRASADLIVSTTPNGGGAQVDTFLVNQDGSIKAARGPFVAAVVTLEVSATPTVAGGNVFLTSGTTTITDFNDGVPGQTITILSEHAVTITDGTNIILNGSANFVMAASDSLTLVLKADNKWYETARMVN